jgi:hypothetical protein
MQWFWSSEGVLFTMATLRDTALRAAPQDDDCGCGTAAIVRCHTDEPTEGRRLEGWPSTAVIEAALSQPIFGDGCNGDDEGHCNGNFGSRKPQIPKSIHGAGSAAVGVPETNEIPDPRPQRCRNGHRARGVGNTHGAGPPARSHKARRAHPNGGADSKLTRPLLVP